MNTITAKTATKALRASGYKTTTFFQTHAYAAVLCVKVHEIPFVVNVSPNISATRGYKWIDFKAISYSSGTNAMRSGIRRAQKWLDANS